MAVYTHITDSELTELLAHYAIGKATNLKGIEQGVENSNYFLTTEQNKYILICQLAKYLYFIDPLNFNVNLLINSHMKTHRQKKFQKEIFDSCRNIYQGMLN